MHLRVNKAVYKVDIFEPANLVRSAHIGHQMLRGAGVRGRTFLDRRVDRRAVQQAGARHAAPVGRLVLGMGIRTWDGVPPCPSELRDVGYADMGWGAAVPSSCTVGMLTVGWVCLAMQVYTQGRFNCGMECAPVPDDTVGWCLVTVTVDVCLAGLMSFREVVRFDVT